MICMPCPADKPYTTADITNCVSDCTATPGIAVNLTISRCINCNGQFVTSDKQNCISSNCKISLPGIKHII